jgi:hypothetical protein
MIQAKDIKTAIFTDAWDEGGKYPRVVEVICLREELKALIQTIDFELAEATKRDTNASVSAKIILYGLKIQIEKRFGLILKEK